MFVICVDFWSHIIESQSIYMNLFLWNLWDLIKNFRISKLDFSSYKTLTWASSGRSNQRSVDRAVDWCAQNVYKALAWGPVDQKVNRSTELALWIWPRSTKRLTDQRAVLSISCLGRPTDRPIGQDLGAVDRTIDQQPQRSEIWPLVGRPPVNLWHPFHC